MESIVCLKVTFTKYLAKMERPSNFVYKLYKYRWEHEVYSHQLPIEFGRLNCLPRENWGRLYDTHDIGDEC